MTDVLEAPLTSAVEDAQRARLEQLRRRRSSSAADTARAGSPGDSDSSATMPLQSRDRPAPRRRPAQGARIATAGFGMATMLGLVGAMGFAQRSTNSTPALPVTTPAPQVVVVIHRGATATSGTTPGTVAATAPAPIALTAQPTVRQAPAVQAPTAQTNGSR